MIEHDFRRQARQRQLLPYALYALDFARIWERESREPLQLAPEALEALEALEVLYLDNPVGEKSVDSELRFGCLFEPSEISRPGTIVHSAI